MKYCLAIDMGASSGRHILGYVENGKLQLQEIYRFENGIVDVNGTLCWDIDKLLYLRDNYYGVTGKHPGYKHYNKEDE